eukprot:7821853-Pyramimonas_sp.AAC.1
MGLRALYARAAMPIAWTHEKRRVRLAGASDLLYLGPVLLHAGIVYHTNQIQHRQRLTCPMAVTEAPQDSLQVVFVPVPVALGRPFVEQVRELHPAVVLVEGRYL